MSANIGETAREFFEACETGAGWDGCKGYCHDGASFAAQSDAIADVTTLEGYCEWMKGLLTFLPDGHYELKTWAVDEGRGSVCAVAIFHGTHTGEGGPVAPTGKAVSADYVYDMRFEDGKIRHMTKIWNDGWTIRDLGWT